MKQGRTLLILGLILAVLAVWAVPSILRAMPDRYVARLPEPLQQLGAPAQQASVLPTAVAPVNAAGLLAVEPTLAAEPAVPTAPATVNAAAPAASTLPPATATPLPTPAPTATPWPIPPAARLAGVTHKFQTWNNCGPATLAMTLTHFGLNLSQDDTAAVLKPNPEDRNVTPDEMAAYVRNETALQSAFRVNGDLDTLRTLVANDIPVIVEIGIEPPGEFRWMGWYGHYLLVVAYDDALEQLWVYDSWFGTSEEPLQNAHPDGRVLSYDQLATYWPHFNRNYIAVFSPEQAATAAAIIGSDMDDAQMWQAALERVQAETTAVPDNAFNWFNLGTTYNALGDYARAATAFDQARAIGLPWRMLWYQFGPYEAYLQTGRYEDVIMLADLTLKDRPYFEESYYYKGLALNALGDTAAAREQFEKAAAFNPHFAPAVAMLEQG